MHVFNLFTKMDKTKVILVEDHELFRMGLRTAIELRHHDITVVGEAETGRDFFTLLETVTADIVLLDIELPDMNGIAIARRLKDEYPQMKILTVSAMNDAKTIEEMLEIGIEGFTSKLNTTPDTLIEAIRTIMQGMNYFGKDIAEIIRRIYTAKKKTTQITTEFTEQEKRIIECCQEGLSCKLIADRLAISTRTVDWHKSKIFHKLGINSTLEMVRFAVKNGIIFFIIFFILTSCSHKRNHETVANTSETNTDFLKAQQYFLENNFDSAQIYINKAFEKMDTCNYLEMADIYLLRSRVFTNFTLYEKAMENAIKALSVSEHHQFTDKKASALFCIGNIHYKMFNDEKAEEYFLQAKSIAEENNFETEMMQIYGAMGMLCLAAQDIKIDRNEEAFLWLNKALEIAQNKNDTLRIIMYLANIGNYYLGLNRYTEINVKNQQNAKKYFDKAMELALLKNATFEMNNIKLSLMRLYRSEKNYQKALEYALDVLQNTENTPNQYSFLLAIYDHLTAIYILLGDKQKAIDVHQQFRTMMLKLSDYKLHQALQEMSVQYETAEKQLEIERQKTEIERQKTTLFIFIGILISSGLLLALLMYIVVLRTRRNRTLAEINALKDKFFSIISHDLKNPVVAQRDSLQLLAENADKLPQNTLSDYHQKLLKSANSMVDLLKNLLNWATIQTGQEIYHPVDFNLIAALQSDINVIKTMAERKNITFETILPPTAVINGDENMLVTTIRNLLANAVKFTQEKGTVTLEISPCNSNETHPVAAKYTVSVTDTGIGMSEEQLRNIFRLDSVHSNRGTAGETGTGLGLIVCKEMLEKHGTVLHIESAKEKGSKFRFNI